MLEGVESLTSNVMVARAVVTPGVSVPVCVMNPTDQPVTLYKGAKIVHLLEVEAVSDDSVLISSVQQSKGASTELETTLWTLVEHASLPPGEQEKLAIYSIDGVC